MNRLYYIAAYRFEQNEWWRFAVTGKDEADARQRFTEGYADTQFTRLRAQYICETPQEVFDEL